MSVSDPNAPLRRGRVLLAEDYEPNALFIAEVLDMAGFDVEVVTDGCVAVERAVAETFAAIIMDIEMPRMDGIAATRAIRKQEAVQGQHAVPILGITGHTMSSIHHLCLTAGMTDIMCKPFRPSLLEARLEAAIGETVPLS
ncbi:response regulator [Asticcacaulis solisilvae]|uniref:response regulator n=1 Tax=Asticcacaulis solisilvae TaxID=1217274 RepID=UPI003FD72200